MEWINVNDKLPKELEYVIGFYINIYSRQNMIYTCWYKEKRFYDDMVDVTNTLTHWMPLPKPPKK